MKKALYIVSFFALVSCTPKDKQFCECITVSKAFNELSQKGISGELSQAELSEAKALQAQKDSICEAYEMMSGEEMLKKKAACGFKE
ncbi:MAG TPA: hypothetical protein PLP27_04335 [Crocinitomicaceae bacterium]|nr:hypothetical protein [Crocinitomicaceae bacterium]